MGLEKKSSNAHAVGGRVMSKILIYDIESSNLNADWGHILCFGFEYYGTGKTKVISLIDTNPRCEGCGRVDALTDAPLIARVREILNDADLLVSWYGREGRGFDSRFINARILAASLPALPRIPQVDLHLLARDRFKFGSNRLANVQSFLQLKDEKTPLNSVQWQKARVGDVKALRYVVEHCRQDVKVLREAYDILRPWVLDHPRMAEYGLCPVCGQDAMIRHKQRVTRAKGKVMQWYCKSCGHYETRSFDGKDK